MQLEESHRREQEEERRAREMEVDFFKAFPDPIQQSEVIAEFALKYPMLSATGAVIRNLAIADWHSKAMRD